MKKRQDQHHPDAGICGAGRGHSHGHNLRKNHDINAGSHCCSTCGTEVSTVCISRDDGKTAGFAEDDSGSGDAEPPVSGAACACSATDDSGGSDDEGSCSCNTLSINLDEDGDETEENDSFKREIKLLSLAGAFLALLLIFEEPIENLIGTYPLYAAFIAIYLTCGTPVLKAAWKAVVRFDFFNEFTLMSTATLAAIGIGKMSEAVGVMLFYRLGEAFQKKAAARSRHSVKALLAQKPMFARIICEGKEMNSSPKNVRKGDVVKVLPGEMIPVDGLVLNGVSLIDRSAITGEHIPVTARTGTAVNGGTLSLDGVLLIEASGPFASSTIARVLEMVQNAVERKSQTERFITRFAKLYTPAVFAIAAAVAVIPPFAGYGAFSGWLYRGLVLLVISCPCALIISIPLGYFGGIGAASSHGILVKGANVFDSLGKITTAVFDKTGTLTHGVFEVAGIVAANGVTEEEVLGAAALAEACSNHPIAKSIRRESAAEVTLPDHAKVTQAAGKGMVLEVDGTVIAAGNAALMADCGVNVPPMPEYGTVVHVQKNKQYLGCIIISDRVKEESAAAVSELKKNGIGRVYMLTGDRETAAALVALELGLDGYRSELLPDGKVSALLELSGGDMSQTLFVGDGVNDGPVIASAGIGVAMGGLGSQVAVEAADAVILDDSPLKVAKLIRIGKKTRTIIWQNVVMAMGVKSAFILFGALGLADLWEAVFADVGVALLAVLNASRAVKIK